MTSKSKSDDKDTKKSSTHEDEPKKSFQQDEDKSSNKKVETKDEDHLLHPKSQQGDESHETFDSTRQPMKKSKPMMKFKLLTGVAAHGKNEEGGTRIFKAKDPDNNIIETDVDLEAKHNSGNIRKFQRIH